MSSSGLGGLMAAAKEAGLAAGISSALTAGTLTALPGELPSTAAARTRAQGLEAWSVVWAGGGWRGMRAAPVGHCAESQRSGL